MSQPPPTPDAPTLPRTTLRGEASVEGPGLFTGRPSRVTLRPTAPGRGLWFGRDDGHGDPLPAVVANVDRQPRHTVLSRDGLRVETVEHLLAALAGAGVSDAEIRVQAPPGSNGHVDVEMPMGDGSARLFFDAVAAAGVTPAHGPALTPLVVHEPVFARGVGGSTIAALPGPTDALEVVYTFDGPPPVGRQVCVFRHRHGDAAPFDRDLASARTFVFADEAEALKQRGWGGHLSYRDLLVLGADGPIDNELRWPDEPVRHKVLDLIGDLALVGRPVCGRVVAHKSGHELNHELARRLLRRDAPRGEADDPVTAGFRHLLGRGAEAAALDVRQIQRILPHRFPMLLIDRVLELDGDRRAVGVKNVTMGDVFFLGHYPGQPIFPGVLIVEAMGQLGGVLLSRKLEHTGRIAVLLSMDGVKLRQPVTPGDQLVLVAEAVRVKSRTGHVRCRAFVLEKLVAEADIKFMLVDADRE